MCPYKYYVSCYVSCKYVPHLKFFKKFYVHNKTLLLNNIHFSLLNELNIEVVASNFYNLVPEKRVLCCQLHIGSVISIGLYRPHFIGYQNIG